MDDVDFIIESWHVGSDSSMCCVHELSNRVVHILAPSFPSRVCSVSALKGTIFLISSTDVTPFTIPWSTSKGNCSSFRLADMCFACNGGDAISSTLASIGLGLIGGEL